MSDLRRLAGAELLGPHLVHCDLCLTAAAIGGAAPATPAPTVAAASPGSSQPVAVVDAPLAAAPVLAYRSRAPPLLAS